MELIICTTQTTHTTWSAYYRYKARHCAAKARRALYMRCDRDLADRWAQAAEIYLVCMELELTTEATICQ